MAAAQPLWSAASIAALRSRTRLTTLPATGFAPHRKAAMLAALQSLRRSALDAPTGRDTLDRVIATFDQPERRQRLRTSVEEFHRMAELGIVGKRAELIRGFVYEKMAASPEHRKLTTQLYDYLRDLRLPGHVVFMEAPLTLTDSEPIPDVMLVAGEKSEFDHRHPATAELIIEVAVSKVTPDRESAALYAEAGVKEYWIVLGARREVEVYRELEGGEYRERRTYAGSDELVCTLVPAIRVSLPALFA